MALGEQFASVLAAAQVGAAWALDVLYRDLAGAVTGYLRLQGAQDPDDVASEAFLGVFRSLGRFEGDEVAFRSWVFSIAHRRLIDDRRHRSRRPPTRSIEGPDAQWAGSHDVENQVLGVLEAERLARLCDRLSPDQRAVILLRLVADLSLEQVASTLDKRVGAIKALQRRGLEALRRELAKEISMKGVSE